MSVVSRDHIDAARERIRGVARVTPMIDVSAIAGRPLFLKCENMQPGGAFKIRGAYNMVAQLAPADRVRGVITYSSGNHGQAVAISAHAVGVPSVVVMPTTAPAVKIDGAKRFGAEVVFAGTTTLHRKAKAEEIAADRGLMMVPPFDHEWIIAGQGTLGLEILEQCPDVATIVVPIGGGGLIGGVAAAVKPARPDVAIVGVEPAGAASMKTSIESGGIRTLDGVQSIADGLLAVRPGELNFAIVRQFVDRLETVEEHEIASAFRWLFCDAKIVAEPSGAVTVAAALRDSATFAPPVVAVISGGNLDPSMLTALLS
ncbi:MAG TPA: threonine/serine dehydratase [Vicinamibacterales bacterium]